MDISLSKSSLRSGQSLQLSGSKSESNRALLLQALYPELSISNLSTADDTRLLLKVLYSCTPLIDVHHAGTAMRFLTAYFAAQLGTDVLLMGSERMHQRPIALLVDALRSLGADITYTEKEGFPPLRIKGKELKGSHVSLQGNVSSQYSSALLLIAPMLPNGLYLELTGSITSLPYLQMTLDLLSYCIGEEHVHFSGNQIRITPADNLQNYHWQVESDWSSASYWYSFVALSPIGTTLSLRDFKQPSLQGDSALQQLYRALGVTTALNDTTLTLTKVSAPQTDCFTADLNATPDIAQTLAVTCLGLGVGCVLSGLHTLSIKETDRLTALQTELSKFGAEVAITTDRLQFPPCHSLNSGVQVATYNDHRMAMAFAPLMLLIPLTIFNKEVVTKSYPTFWQDVAQLTVEDEEK